MTRSGRVWEGRTRQMERDRNPTLPSGVWFQLLFLIREHQPVNWYILRQMCKDAVDGDRFHESLRVLVSDGLVEREGQLVRLTWDGERQTDVLRDHREEQFPVGAASPSEVRARNGSFFNYQRFRRLGMTK